MQRKVSTGRLRGRRSRVASKILEYLVLISSKYGIEPNDLFDKFVEAWENQKSRCKELTVECRVKTESRAVFLVTTNNTVVAQFSVPNHLLKEKDVLKGFKYTPKRTPPVFEKDMLIGDLRIRMKRVNIKARVLEVPKPRIVLTRFGTCAKVANTIIADKTGRIQLPLWNKQIDTVSVGDVIQVENARVTVFRGGLRLRVGRYGRLYVIKTGPHPQSLHQDYVGVSGVVDEIRSTLPSVE